MCVWGGGGGCHHYIGLFLGHLKFFFNVNYSIGIFLGMLTFLICLGVCLIC